MTIRETQDYPAIKDSGTLALLENQLATVEAGPLRATGLDRRASMTTNPHGSVGSP